MSSGLSVSGPLGVGYLAEIGVKTVFGAGANFAADSAHFSVRCSLHKFLASVWACALVIANAAMIADVRNIFMEMLYLMVNDHLNDPKLAGAARPRNSNRCLS